MPLESFNISYNAEPDKIYQAALQQFAQVKAVHLRTESAEKNIRSIRGELYPTLSLSGDVNTNYSSVATQSVLLNSAFVTSTDYVLVTGYKVPVITQQDTFEQKKKKQGRKPKKHK